jgi:hypothetical protein
MVKPHRDVTRTAGIRVGALKSEGFVMDIRDRIRKGTGTDEQYAECFREHLPYEINMFRELYAFLEVCPAPAILISNACIESFFSHARNLVMFFKNDTDCAFDPRYFTNIGYETNKKFLPDTLRNKLNHQIFHIAATRTAILAEKLGSKDRTTLADIIEDEIARFEKALTLGYRNRWVVRPRVQLVRTTGSAVEATNHVFSAPSWFPFDGN